MQRAFHLDILSESIHKALPYEALHRLFVGTNSREDELFSFQNVIWGLHLVSQPKTSGEPILQTRFQIVLKS